MLIMRFLPDQRKKQTEDEIILSTNDFFHHICA
jgi:hypothetical protein